MPPVDSRLWRQANEALCGAAHEHAHYEPGVPTLDARVRDRVASSFVTMTVAALLADGDPRDLSLQLLEGVPERSPALPADPTHGAVHSAIVKMRLHAGGLGTRHSFSEAAVQTAKRNPLKQTVQAILFVSNIGTHQAGLDLTHVALQIAL